MCIQNGTIRILMPPPYPPFSAWLDQRYLEWQNRQGGSRSLLEFGKHLGVKQSTLSQWINGRRVPQDKEIIDALAFKLGDEIYDVLDLPRPDPDYAYVHYVWKELSDDQKSALKEQIKKFLAENAGK